MAKFGGTTQVCRNVNITIGSDYFPFSLICTPIELLHEWISDIFSLRLPNFIVYSSVSDIDLYSLYKLLVKY